MNIKLNEKQKEVIEKSLNIINEFNMVNFQPYINTLNEYIDIELDKKEDIGKMILTAQTKLANNLENNIKLTEFGESVLSAFKKTQNDNWSFTDSEVEAISFSTEATLRLGLGQIGYGRDILMTSFAKIDTENFVDIASLFDKAEQELDCRYGIFSKYVKEEVRNAYDIHQVLRNYISWKRNPEGGIGVSFDRPMKTGSEPLVEVVKEEKKSKNKFKV